MNAEAHVEGAQITNFGDALWWAIVTITTVGYGDFAPVTVQGRIIASGLMVVGIALLGVVTASVAAWFVRLTNTKKAGEDVQKVTRRSGDEVKRLAERVESLEAKIDRLLERDQGSRR